MMRGIVRCGVFFLLQSAVAVIVPFTSHAQGAPKTSNEIGINYNEQVRQVSRQFSLKDDLFGDDISLYTGEVQFKQTDVDIRGNDRLPMRVTRKFSNSRTSANLHAVSEFADWELDLPHISGIYSARSGWISMVSGDPDKRCSIPLSSPSQASPPPEYVVASGNVGVAFDPHFFWSGNTLHMPGGGDQRLLIANTGAATPVDGTVSHWITSGRWMVSCLPSTKNGIPGEGFLVHAPNGDRYWFDWIAARYAGKLETSYGMFPFNYNATLSLTEFRAMPTRIEDVHGNYMILTYANDASGKLLSMNASDGRSINITYNNGMVSQVTAGGRIWQYNYSGSPTARLASVVLPDGTRWEFDATATPSPSIAGWKNCADYVPVTVAPLSITTMRHPSGAVGTFTFQHRQHGRTNAANTCRMLGSMSYPVASHLLISLSINKKTISGPGVPEQSWSYAYSPLAASLETGQHIFCETTPCPSTRTLTVTRQNGDWARYTFSQKYGDLEGRLLMEEHGDVARMYRRTENKYHTILDGTYSKIGTDPCWTCSREDEMPKPIETITTLQDGATFQYRVEQYDAFARPIKVTRSSSR